MGFGNGVIGLPISQKKLALYFDKYSKYDEGLVMPPIRRQYPAMLGYCPLRHGTWYSFLQQLNSVDAGAKG